MPGASRPALPGYYYDEERGRYFRVLNSGQAPSREGEGTEGPMAKYTISSLADAERNRKEQPRKAIMPLPPLSFRENHRLSKLGVYPQCASERIEASSLNPPTVSASARNGQITALSCDDSTGMMYVGADFGFFYTLSYRDLGPLTEIVSPSTGYSVTSISNTNGFVLLTHNVLGTTAASVYSKSTGITITCQLGETHSIWSGCLSGSGNTVSLGTSAGFFTFDPSTSKSDLLLRTMTVIRCVDAKGSLVLGGGINGKVFMADPRTKKNNERAEVCLDHKTSVTHVRARDNSVIVTGLKNKMSLYDLRNPQAPVLDFPGYRNWDAPCHGFTLNENNTIAAVGIRGGAVLLYDTKTAQILPSPFSGSAVPEAVIPSALAWSPDSGLHAGYSHTIHTSTNRWSPRPVAQVLVENGLATDALRQLGHTIHGGTSLRSFAQHRFASFAVHRM